MRATLRDVVHHPGWLDDWWIELPMRRSSWWREVLLTPGEGWLCWSSDWRRHVSYDPPDLDEWVVFPPLHRAWLAVTGWVRHPWWVLRGDCRWNEWPSLADVSCLKSDERKHLFR
jgi:hypothetical protein